MIPSPFDYIAASTVEEAIQALSEAGEDAKVLAGGQSPAASSAAATGGANDDRGSQQDQRAARGSR
jgi:carbon-monoxide dehydrogenase medium subunit